VATASGQAAEFLTFACLAGAGDQIVAAAGLYGGTVTQVVANPSGEVADLAGLAEVAHAAGVPMVVDSTLATPFSVGRSSTARTS
jgi:O-acetylhomoserine (thiol)-lyase